MKKLTLTFMLTGLALVLTATPVLQKVLPNAALRIAAAQDVNEPDGDNNQEGTEEADGDNNNVDDGEV